MTNSTAYGEKIPNAPETARKRGRPPGVATPLGRAFMEWPFGEWIRLQASDPENATRDANSLRNLAWRKGVRATVLTDSLDPTVLYILKYKEGC